MTDNILYDEDEIDWHGAPCPPPGVPEVPVICEIIATDTPYPQQQLSFRCPFCDQVHYATTPYAGYGLWESNCGQGEYFLRDPLPGETVDLVSDRALKFVPYDAVRNPAGFNPKELAEIAAREKETRDNQYRDWLLDPDLWPEPEKPADWKSDEEIEQERYESMIAQGYDPDIVKAVMFPEPEESLTIAQIVRAEEMWDELAGFLTKEFYEEHTAKCDFPVLSPDECELSNPRPYVLKGVLSLGDVMLVTARPGAGKSAFAPFVGYAVAQGRSIFGRRVRSGRVLYVACEDGDGMRVRVRALRQRFGDAHHFHLVPFPIDMMTVHKPPQSTNERLNQLYTLIRETQPALVIIDTIAAAFPGLVEESGAADGMGRVRAVLRHMTRLNGAAVMAMMHPPHGADRGRGHSSLPADADVDAFIKVEPNKPRMMTFLKNRNGSSDLTLSFDLHIAEMGKDDDGDPITAVTIDDIGTGVVGGSARPDINGLKPLARKMLALAQELSVDGKVDEAAWLDTCEDRRMSTASRATDRRKAFRAAFGELLDANLAVAGGGMVRLAGSNSTPTPAPAPAPTPAGPLSIGNSTPGNSNQVSPKSDGKPLTGFFD